MAALFSALLLLAIAVPALAQHSALRINASFSEYCGEVYTDPPKDGRGTFVFFSGEEIHLRLSLWNSDRDRAHDVVASTDSADRGFMVKAYRDDQPVEVDLRIESRGSLFAGGPAAPLDWVSRISLAPLSYSEWPATTTIDEVGVQVLQIYPLVKDEEGKDVPSFGGLAFDVRHRTPQAELELIRRQACREVRRDDLSRRGNGKAVTTPPSRQQHRLHHAR